MFIVALDGKMQFLLAAGFLLPVVTALLTTFHTP
jgi:hypothetical protein